MSNIVNCSCPRCGVKDDQESLREHRVVNNHKLDEQNDFSFEDYHTYYIAKCRSCGTINFIYQYWNSQWDQESDRPDYRAIASEDVPITDEDQIKKRLRRMVN